jgi:hypothetical protein
VLLLMWVCFLLRLLVHGCGSFVGIVIWVQALTRSPAYWDGGRLDLLNSNLESANELKQTMVECPTDGHIRDRLPNLFAYQHGHTVEAWPQTVISGDCQGQLARCLFKMDMLRRVLFGQGHYFWRDAQAATAWLQPSHDMPCLLTGGWECQGRKICCAAGFGHCCHRMCRITDCTVSK